MTAHRQPPQEIAINVTQEHIDKGKPGECARCPIALAFLDALPEIKSVAVDGSCATVHYPYARVDWLYWLPREAGDFVGAFDDGEGVAPFSFTAQRFADEL